MRDDFNLRDEIKSLHQKSDEILHLLKANGSSTKYKPNHGEVPPGWECKQAMEFRRIRAERAAGIRDEQ